jgi:hypothetical protein
MEDILYDETKNVGLGVALSDYAESLGYKAAKKPMKKTKPGHDARNLAKGRVDPREHALGEGSEHLY